MTREQSGQGLAAVNRSGAVPRRKVKLVDEIIETLRQDVVTRRIPDGARLPSEKELSERFSVSQPTVREAIRALETMGLVEVLHGNGSFVRSQGDFAVASALQTLLQLESVQLMEVLGVRQVLGMHSIELASVNATTDDIAAITLTCRAFDRLDSVKEVEGVIAHILGFQRAVSAASHSPLLQSLEAFLLALLNEVQVNLLSRRGVRFWRARAMEFQPHRVAILAGLQSKNPVTARVVMSRYFDAQRIRFGQDDKLNALDLSSPSLINIVANMVHQFKS